jgi:hypothetical protein
VVDWGQFSVLGLSSEAGTCGPPYEQGLTGVGQVLSQFQGSPSLDGLVTWHTRGGRGVARAVGPSLANSLEPRKEKKQISK